MMKKQVTRRGFLKGLGLGAGVVAAAGGITNIPKLKRQPTEGERFRLFGDPGLICTFCDKSIQLDEDLFGIYSGTEEMEDEMVHTFLIEDSPQCSWCNRRLTHYYSVDMKFIEKQL